MEQAQELLHTPLHAAHLQARARMVEFAGWEMPLLYTGIVEEHGRTRADATVFDVSHMARLELRGDHAFRLLDRACTAEVVRQEDNTARYSLLCNPAGGVVDDIFVIRLDDRWMVVANASNREKVVAHLSALNEEGGFGATIEDRTLQSAMLALQGPAAGGKLAGLLSELDLAAVGRHQVIAGNYMGFDYLVSRTGYTGEDGFEIVLSLSAATLAWEFLLSPQGGFAPAGLGARDVLRLEAGLPLYGHELTEGLDPLSAGLDKAVRAEGPFVGAEALAEIRRTGPARRRVGIRLDTRRTARQGAVVFADGWEVGVVTSGVFSPSCQASIAMAYVDRQFVGSGQELVIQLPDGEDIEAEVVPLPFYRRKKNG